MVTRRLPQGVLSIIIIVTSIAVYSTKCALSQSLGTKVSDQLQTFGQVEIENFQVFTKIKYRYARTMVFCQMHNTHQTEGQEAMLELDLPEDAFISNFTMEISNKQYKSFITERKKANERYGKARGNGHTAGIVNQEHEQHFNVSISLAANSSVLFFLEYEEEIPKFGLGHSYQYSLSLVPQAKVKHFCVDIEILEYKPFHFTSVNLRNKYGNSTVQLDLKKDAVILETEKGNRTRIIWEPSILKGLSESGVLGKFQLNYHFNSEESLNDIVVRNGYFVHRFDSRNLTKKLPLYIIFVMDVSGSMIGLRGNRTKEAMDKILLHDLDTEQDFFHVITFSSSVKHLKMGGNSIQNFYPATKQLKEKAMEYINHQIFQGNTNIHDALTQALETAANYSSSYKEYCQQLQTWGSYSTRCANNSAPTPTVFFLTDGYATTGIVDREAILKQVQMKNTNRVPIFSIGLGTEADHFLLEALSIMNYGIARKIYNDADVALQLQDFYQLVASPVLKDINFWYTNRNLQFSTSFDVSYNDDRPWLTSQDEILVTGRLHPVQTNESSVRHSLSSHHGLEQLGYTVYKTDMEHAEFQARICKCGICPHSTDKGNTTDFLSSLKLGGRLCPTNGEDDMFMERFWVHKTLRGLIKKAVILGSESVKQEIVSLSKQYNLVTPFTSLLILIPVDNKGSNAQYYDPPSVPDIIRSPSNNIIPKNFIPNRVRHTTKLVHYSGISKLHSKAVGNNTEIRPSLVSYLRSLQDAQENVTKQRNFSSVSAKPKLSIPDIKWITGENFSLHLRNNRNEQTGVFHLLTNLSRNFMEELVGSKTQPCISATTKGQGSCVHLTTCMESAYAKNITTFLKRYFCPIISKSKVHYIGTCCED